MTNDRRMVPGPSDEEIEQIVEQIHDLLIYCWHDKREENNAKDFARECVRAALARWGAQTECDPAKVEALLDNYERLLFEARDVHVVRLHKKIESVVSDEWLAEEKAKVAAVRSSSCPKGRVVEGIVYFDSNGKPLSVGFGLTGKEAERFCDGMNQYGHRAAAIGRVKILDAPEEG